MLYKNKCYTQFLDKMFENLGNYLLFIKQRYYKKIAVVIARYLSLPNRKYFLNVLGKEKNGKSLHNTVVINYRFQLSSINFVSSYFLFNP